VIENALEALTLLDEMGIAALCCDKNGRIEEVNNAAYALFQLTPAVKGRQLSKMKGLATLAKLSGSPVELSLLDKLFCRVRIQNTEMGQKIFCFEDVSAFHDQEQLRTDVMSMVVHDLRTPISAIKSYAELATQVGPVTPQQQQFLNRVQQAVHTTNMLLNDLLDITWIDSGVPIQKQEVNIAYLVHTIFESLEQRAHTHGVTLHITIGPDLPPVFGEPHRLERVFSNLIVNAIKYSGEGKSVYVTVSRAGQYITVAVADNGMGIPSEHLPHIFDRFYRVPNEDHRKEGMGLGLAIVKAIVEKHGGHVEVQSEVGQGSTFMVVLPIGD
jgi:signal transduction histidine kinase